LFPTLHTVTHAVADVTGTNALGQATVELTSQSRSVFGWSPKVNADGSTPVMAGRVITEVYLLTPDGDYSDGDIVTLPDGRDFIVVGEPEDNNVGPFGFTPGYKVTLRRVHDGPTTLTSGGS
jgi:hypothetical protein